MRAFLKKPLQTGFVISAMVASALSSIAMAEPAPIRRLAPLEATESGKYPPSMVPPGQKFDGSFEDRLVYRSSDGKYSVHMWSSGPGILDANTPYPQDEYSQILSGDLQITNATGEILEFRAGDSFVIPKGWQGIWKMKTRFVKYYVIYENDRSDTK